MAIRELGIDRLAGVVRLTAVFGFLVALPGSPVRAQNLVPNPSFEIYSLCPNFQDQINQAPPWTRPTAGSSDYFNTCAGSGTFVGVPANDMGNQVPLTGNAYAGFILRPVNEYREYIEVPLTCPLVSNVAYQVSFYVSLSDQSQWAVDKVGAYLSVGSVGPVITAPPLPYTPQIANPPGNFITSKSTWTLVTGTYIASGGESHLVIGNFANNASTTTITGLGGFYPGSYYYIDDVSVTETPVPNTCEPLCDGSGCRETVCSNPDEFCAATQMIYDPATGQSTVTDCGCGCWIRLNDVPPHEPLICVGDTCPDSGKPCQLTATPNANGTITYDCCAGCELPIKQFPGLVSITFWESTFNTPPALPTPFTFAVNGGPLTTQLPGTLGPGNRDFEGVPGGEFYDVFYSDANGTFNVNGKFVTTEAVWNVGAPSGGGLNLARVDFNFSNGSTWFANTVASFAALGNNSIPGSEQFAVDGDLLTDTTMGNTIGTTQRLRVTVGISCPCRPLPDCSACQNADCPGEVSGVCVGGNHNGMPCTLDSECASPGVSTFCQLTPTEKCRPKCVKYNQLTGQVTVAQCDCVGDECFVQIVPEITAGPATIRIATTPNFQCSNNCPAGQECVQTTTPLRSCSGTSTPCTSNADCQAPAGATCDLNGTMTVCCDCVDAAVCEPKPDGMSCTNNACPSVACPPNPPGAVALPNNLCGVLEDGVNSACIILRSQDGSATYEVRNPAALAPFGVGDKVRLCGYVDHGHTSCQQGPPIVVTLASVCDAGRHCQPRCLRKNLSTGQTLVHDCTCRDVEGCHVEQGAEGPVCTGECPSGKACLTTRTQSTDPVTGISYVDVCCDCEDVCPLPEPVNPHDPCAMIQTNFRDCVSDGTDQTCLPRNITLFVNYGCPPPTPPNWGPPPMVTGCDCAEPGACGPITMTGLGEPSYWNGIPYYGNYMFSCTGDCPAPGVCQLFHKGTNSPTFSPTGMVSLTAHDLAAGVLKCDCPVPEAAALKVEPENDRPEATAGLDSIPICPDYFADDFEFYPLGPICGQGGWEEWAESSDVCGAVTSEQAFDGLKAIKIVGSVGGSTGLGDDTVHRFNASGGSWTFRAMTFVPNDATGTGFVILLNTYDDPPGAPSGTYRHSVQVQFNAVVNFVLAEPAPIEGIPLVRGRWAEFRLEIDLDNDSAFYFYDGQFFSARSWVNGVSTGGRPLIQALDLYAGEPFANGTSGMYFDAISLRSAKPCPPTECAEWGDFDGDGDTDLDDFARLFDCLRGPGGGVPAGCDAVNLEADADIDMQDVGRFQNLFAGP